MKLVGKPGRPDTKPEAEKPKKAKAEKPATKTKAEA